MQDECTHIGMIWWLIPRVCLRRRIKGRVLVHVFVQFGYMLLIHCGSCIAIQTYMALKIFQGDQVYGPVI